MKYYLDNKTKEKPFLFTQGAQQSRETVNVSMRKLQFQPQLCGGSLVIPSQQRLTPGAAVLGDTAHPFAIPTQAERCHLPADGTLRAALIQPKGSRAGDAGYDHA